MTKDAKDRPEYCGSFPCPTFPCSEHLGAFDHWPSLSSSSSWWHFPALPTQHVYVYLSPWGYWAVRPAVTVSYMWGWELHCISCRGRMDHGSWGPAQIALCQPLGNLYWLSMKALNLSFCPQVWFLPFFKLFLNLWRNLKTMSFMKKWQYISAVLIQRHFFFFTRANGQSWKDQTWGIPAWILSLL